MKRTSNFPEMKGQENSERETTLDFFPPENVGELGDSNSRIGSYHPSQYNKSILESKGHVMTGFLKFLGCCSER